MDKPKIKRTVITKEVRALIVNVYKFLKREYVFTMMYKDCKCDLSHLRNISRRTADATNVSLRTVAQVLTEDRKKNPKEENKVYKFQKSKNTGSMVTDPDSLCQELEMMETAILAEACEEKEEKREEIISVKKEVDNMGISWQPAKVKTEVEEEEIHWKEAEVNTEIEKEDIDIKEEADDYEITIEEGPVGC